MREGRTVIGRGARILAKPASGVAVLLLLGQPPQVAAKPAAGLLATAERIRRADYEGDRAALKKLFDALGPYLSDGSELSRVHYWRGFALWRRAINGMNESVPGKELADDLKNAMAEFELSTAVDPKFADSRVGALSCVSLLAFTVPADAVGEDQRALILRGRTILKEAQELDPENPRLQWVLGPNVWFIPVEKGGGQERAIALYTKGLATARARGQGPPDSLDPTWGEPELLMSLAWSNLNRATPDLASARQYADQALKIVPDWHYVKDILIPQIDEAQKKLK
jgi:hypothetical protein